MAIRRALQPRGLWSHASGQTTFETDVSGAAETSARHAWQVVVIATIAAPMAMRLCRLSASKYQDTHKEESLQHENDFLAENRALWTKTPQRYPGVADAIIAINCRPFANMTPNAIAAMKPEKPLTSVQSVEDEARYDRCIAAVPQPARMTQQ